MRFVPQRLIAAKALRSGAAHRIADLPMVEDPRRGKAALAALDAQLIHTPHGVRRVRSYGIRAREHGIADREIDRRILAGTKRRGALALKKIAFRVRAGKFPNIDDAEFLFLRVKLLRQTVYPIDAAEGLIAAGGERFAAQRHDLLEFEHIQKSEHALFECETGHHSPSFMSRSVSLAARSPHI